MIFTSSLTRLNHCTVRNFSSSPLLLKGIKIGFFGSDEFSIVSLRKLIEISKRKDNVIESIDVITKYPKATGRNFKEITDVPIAEVAQQEGLSLIRAETNQEINDLTTRNYDLAVAVSYGKLIPKKFIQTVSHTINVHPSLLPTYMGASPLQYAYLNEDTFSGVTVQTLHETTFDKGDTIAQTREIPISDCEDIATLRDRLAFEGAELLGKVVETGAYKDTRIKPKYAPSLAPKFKPSFCLTDWEATATKICRQLKIMGSLFSYKEIDVIKKKRRVQDWRRVIFYDATVLPDIKGFRPGQFKFQDPMIAIQTGKGAIGVKRLKFEYEKEENASEFIQKLNKRAGETSLEFVIQPQPTPESS